MIIYSDSRKTENKEFSSSSFFAKALSHFPFYNERTKAQGESTLIFQTFRYMHNSDQKESFTCC